MAKTVNVIVTDDLDGSGGAKAVLFSFQGASYEIDLSPANEAKLAESLEPYIKAARNAGGPRRGVVMAEPGIATRCYVVAGLIVADLRADGVRRTPAMRRRRSTLLRLTPWAAAREAAVAPLR